MRSLDAAAVEVGDLDMLEATVKGMPADSQLAFFLAAVAAAVRGGDDVIAGRESDLVSPAQAAKLLGVSRVHLYKLMDSNELPAVNVGRDRRVSLGNVESMLEERDRASKELAERFSRAGAVRREAIGSLKG